MQGGRNRQLLERKKQGYTIVEIMVVLAVSGIMFLIAATFINGKQQKAAFTSGVNQMASQLQDMLEQVGDGRYSDVPLNCSVSGGLLTFPSGGSAQGANQDCVFRGKLLHFYGSPEENYELLSLADARTDAGPETNLISASVAGIPTLTTQAFVPQHLDVIKVKAGGALTNNIAVLQGLGDYSGGTLLSGALRVELAYSDKPTGTSLDGTETTITGGPTMHIIKSATICLSDGTEFATIDIGATNSNPTSVNVQSGLPSCP